MRGNKAAVGLALMAVLALAITATVGSVASASGVQAVTAKKKCKKKKPKKHSATSAKKKRCKQRKNFPPVSLARATLTWSNGTQSNVDLDLFVLDGQGRQAGNGSDAIPSSDLSPDVQGASGSETFTDLTFLAGGKARPFSYGVCFHDIGSVHVDYTIDYVTVDGMHHTTSESYGSSGVFTNYAPDGVAMPAGYCTD